MEALVAWVAFSGNWSFCGTHTLLKPGPVYIILEKKMCYCLATNYLKCLIFRMRGYLQVFCSFLHMICAATAAILRNSGNLGKGRSFHFQPGITSHRLCQFNDSTKIFDRRPPSFTVSIGTLGKSQARQGFRIWHTRRILLTLAKY